MCPQSQQQRGWRVVKGGKWETNQDCIGRPQPKKSWAGNNSVVELWLLGYHVKTLDSGPGAMEKLKWEEMPAGILTPTRAVAANLRPCKTWEVLFPSDPS